MFILFVIIGVGVVVVGLLAAMVAFSRKRRGGRDNDQSAMTSARGNPEPTKVGRASGPD